MTIVFNRARPIFLLFLCLLVTSGCSKLNQMEQRMLTGGAIGTTVGVVGTAVTGGCIACGAAIGGAVGVGTGYVYDYLDNKNN